MMKGKFDYSAVRLDPVIEAELLASQKANKVVDDSMMVQEKPVEEEYQELGLLEDYYNLAVFAFFVPEK